MAFLEHQRSAYKEQVQEYPRHKELEMFYEHLEKVLIDTQFLSQKQPTLVMNKLRRLFNRARPELQELNILRGILTSIEKKKPQNSD
jgi:tRNA (cytidine32/uridine32-2'-O)-methyltransferase